MKGKNRSCRFELGICIEGSLSGDNRSPWPEQWGSLPRSIISSSRRFTSIIVLAPRSTPLHCHDGENLIYAAVGAAAGFSETGRRCERTGSSRYNIARL